VNDTNLSTFCRAQFSSYRAVSIKIIVLTTGGGRLPLINALQQPLWISQ